MVVAAALAITVATRLATPDSFIFFGILHQIALASLLGLAFLRLPALFVLAAAALVVAAPHYLRAELFDHPALWWVGLSATPPRSNDYVPLFPWFGAVLAGIGAAKLAASSGLLAWLGGLPSPRWTLPLRLAGRHSLAVYLVHQPVLIACIWLFSQILPAESRSPQAEFTGACRASCAETRDTAFCSRYCGCMLDRLGRDGMLEGLYQGDRSAGFTRRVGDLASSCTTETDSAMGEGKTP
jgi:uncharacterized membrane protein